MPVVVRSAVILGSIVVVAVMIARGRTRRGWRMLLHILGVLAFLVLINWGLEMLFTDFAAIGAVPVIGAIVLAILLLR
jgi:hypothetical protein